MVATEGSGYATLRDHEGNWMVLEPRGTALEPWCYMRTKDMKGNVPGGDMHRPSGDAYRASAEGMCRRLNRLGAYPVPNWRELMQP